MLTAAAKHADLVVVGAHVADGRDGMRPGPIAHALLDHAECPVVIVPRD